MECFQSLRHMRIYRIHFKIKFQFSVKKIITRNSVQTVLRRMFT